MNVKLMELDDTSANDKIGERRISKDLGPGTEPGGYHRAIWKGAGSEYHFWYKVVTDP